MWATAEESAAHIKGFYRRACGHADKTIETLSRMLWESSRGGARRIGRPLWV